MIGVLKINDAGGLLQRGRRFAAPLGTLHLYRTAGSESLGEHTVGDPGRITRGHHRCSSTENTAVWRRSLPRCLSWTASAAQVGSVSLRELDRFRCISWTTSVARVGPFPLRELHQSQMGTPRRALSRQARRCRRPFRPAHEENLNHIYPVLPSPEGHRRARARITWVHTPAEAGRAPYPSQAAAT